MFQPSGVEGLRESIEKYQIATDEEEVFVPIVALCLDKGRVFNIGEKAEIEKGFSGECDFKELMKNIPDRFFNITFSNKDMTKNVIHISANPETSEFALSFSYFENKQWRLMPAMACSNTDSHIFTLHTAVTDEKFLDVCKQNFNACTYLFGFFLTVLSCNNVYTEKVVVPRKVNSKRLKKGKVPFVEYHILKIKPSVSPNIERGGSHASPRLHFRRGHVRRCQSGITVWVRSSMVGESRKGLIIKHYEVDGKEV